MKRYYLIICSTILLSCIGLVSCNQTNKPKLSELNSEFENPSSEYRSAPLWVWNTKVTHGDIDRMLTELKEAGFGGAFIHPRPGMITEYLSDDWFELYTYSYEKAKILGMNIWIYDENSYPSGFAGGNVPAQMPESYNEGFGMVYEKVTSLPNDMAPYSIALKQDGEKYIDITSKISDHKGQEGIYFLYKKTFFNQDDWHGGYSYVDILHPGVTEKFIEVTMTGYEKHFGDKLGTEIKGIFTDEPNIMPSGGMRWTKDLFSEFEKKWGYDLKLALPLLSEETGNWKEVRHNYQETLLQMFIDRWSKPWFNYCEKHNLKWTGHYWEHGWPGMQMGPDNMAMYAWHQMPAIDMLFNQYNDVSPQAQFGNARAVKELRSVANQMGYKRTLSETYGGGGWDETFQDFKRLGDWEYVLGVNFLNQHLSHMTIVGARKYDYPPVFTSHSPWWNNYKEQNDYFARLSVLLSNGEQYNDILVIEPTTTVWEYFSHFNGNENVNKIGETFQSFVTTLEKQQVEYDLGSENIIKDQGRVNEGKFVIGKRAYKKVVLPPMMENLNAKTFELLKQFVASGGELICFSTPTLVHGSDNAELKKYFADNAAKMKHYEDLTKSVIEESFRNNDIKFVTTSNHLYHQRRTYGDGELVFIVNSSLDETYTGNISVKGESLYLMDAMDGKYYAYPHTANGKHVDAKFNLPPAGSLLLFSSNNAKKDYPSKADFTEKTIVKATSDVKVERLKDNAMTLDFCDLIIDGKKTENIYVPSASHILFKAMGLSNGNPWNSAVQYKTTIVDKDTFKTGHIQVQYRFHVAEKIDMSKWRVVAEQPNIWSMKINGKDVKSNAGESWLDSRFGVYNAGDYLKQGDNIVELFVSPMSIYAEVEPVYVLGDFAVEPTDKGWEIKTPRSEFTLGDWVSQGQPFYSWDMAYSKKYEIDDTSSSYAIKLNDWQGTVSEVYINGSKIGSIAYQPYTLDITPYLKKGENKVEVRVIGSLRNLLGPHFTEDKGITGPWHWRGVDKRRKGLDYKMFKYGLMSDFDLYKATSR